MIEVDVIEEKMRAALSAAFLDSTTGVVSVTIDSVPDEPTAENYATLGSKSCCLLQHAGVVYQDPAILGRMAAAVASLIGLRMRTRQMVTVTSALEVGAKSMRRREGHYGALEILRIARLALTGLVIGEAEGGNPVVLAPRAQGYLGQWNGVYWYKLLFEHTDTYTGQESSVP